MRGFVDLKDFLVSFRLLSILLLQGNRRVLRFRLFGIPLLTLLNLDDVPQPVLVIRSRLAGGRSHRRHLALLLSSGYSWRRVERHQLRILSIAFLAADGNDFLALVLLHFDLLVLHRGVNFDLVTLFDQIDFLLDLEFGRLLDPLEDLSRSWNFEVGLRLLTQTLYGLGN